MARGKPRRRKSVDPRYGSKVTRYDRRIEAQRHVRKPVIRLQHYIARTIDPTPKFVRKAATRQRVVQQIGRRPKPQRVRSVSRIVVHPFECTRRRDFKKTMMRKLAAQVLRAGGLGSANRWRKTLHRQKPSERLC